MAKWGEGDERWIVSERQDGANVNGWHWQEKNCMGWGRERLSALLETVVFELDAGTAQVKEISKFDGDASVTIRKGDNCLLYTSPSPRDRQKSRMPSSA